MLSCLNWRSSIALTVSHLRSRSPCCTAPRQFSLKKFPIMTQDKKMLNICLGGTYWVIRSSVTLSENLTCKSTIKIFLYLEIFSFCLEGQDESRSVIAYRAGSRPQRLSRPQSPFLSHVAKRHHNHTGSCRCALHILLITYNSGMSRTGLGLCFDTVFTERQKIGSKVFTRTIRDKHS